jgi:hypothetical protein
MNNRAAERGRTCNLLRVARQPGTCMLLDIRKVLSWSWHLL